METQGDGGIYGVYSLHLDGSWCVGMNANTTSAAVWHLPRSWVGRSVIELIGEKSIARAPTEWALGPGASAILRPV